MFPSAMKRGKAKKLRFPPASAAVVAEDRQIAAPVSAVLDDVALLAGVADRHSAAEAPAGVTAAFQRQGRTLVKAQTLHGLGRRSRLTLRTGSLTLLIKRIVKIRGQPVE